VAGPAATDTARRDSTVTSRQGDFLFTKVLFWNKWRQKSQLPLTDPRDTEAQRMLNIPYRII